MSKNSKSSSSEGVAVLSLLALIFIILKLTGSIGWSWWWVLSPLWIPAAIALLIFAVTLIGIVAVAIGKINGIPVAKGENIDRIAELHGLQRGFMDSDERLRKRIREAMKTTNRRSNK